MYRYKQVYNGGKFEKTSAYEMDLEKNKEYFSNVEFKKYLEEIIQQADIVKHYNDIKHRMPYQHFNQLLRSTIHVGQLKLFLTELQFLTEICTDKNEAGYFIYAGSAPSNKMSYLHELFPNIKFVLTDPNEHVIMYGDKTHYNDEHSNNVIYFCANTKNLWRHNYRVINMYVDGNIERLDKKSDASRIHEINENFIKNHNGETIAKFIESSNFTFYIIEDLMTEQLAQTYSYLQGNRYFVSDIRSNIFTMMDTIRELNPGIESNKDFLKYESEAPKKKGMFTDESPGDIDILWNNALQLLWINILKPQMCMLKFRCPFFNEPDVRMLNVFNQFEPYKSDFNKCKELGFDFVSDYKNSTFNYIHNEHINIQAFPGVISTEARLITNNYKTKIAYNAKEYEDKYFYYNRVHRPYGYHNAYEQYFDAKIGIDACGDCALTLDIFNDYIKKYNIDSSPKQMLEMVLNMIGRKLNIGLHGLYQEHIPDVQVQQKIFMNIDTYEDFKDKINWQHKPISHTSYYDEIQQLANTDELQKILVQFANFLNIVGGTNINILKQLLFANIKFAEQKDVVEDFFKIYAKYINMENGDYENLLKTDFSKPLQLNTIEYMLLANHLKQKISIPNAKTESLYLLSRTCS